jgi:hypothetical protein
MEDLPEEVLVKILNEVAVAERLTICTFVCQKWRRLALDTTGDLARGGHRLFSLIVAADLTRYTPALAKASAYFITQPGGFGLGPPLEEDDGDLSGKCTALGNIDDLNDDRLRHVRGKAPLATLLWDDLFVDEPILDALAAVDRAARGLESTAPALVADRPRLPSTRNVRDAVVPPPYSASAPLQQPPGPAAAGALPGLLAPMQQPFALDAAGADDLFGSLEATHLRTWDDEDPFYSPDLFSM